MDRPTAQALLDKIIGQVTGYQNPYSLEQFYEKFAFDIRLPLRTQDSFTGEETWTQNLSASKYVTYTNKFELPGLNEWKPPKQSFHSMDDILGLWQQINHTVTELQIESENVSESDSVHRSQNVYRSQVIHDSKNVLFSDTARRLENVAAIQRSSDTVFSVRVEDSSAVSNSFNVNWSGKISNSFFIQDCYDMFECMFCSHMTGKRYCIGNMQFEEAEYMEIKKQVIEWMLSQ